MCPPAATCTSRSVTNTQTNNISLQIKSISPDLPDRLEFYSNLYWLIIRNEMLASCFILDFALQSCLGFNKTHHLVPLTEPCPPGATTSFCKQEFVFALLKDRVEGYSWGKFLLRHGTVVACRDVCLTSVSVPLWSWEIPGWRRRHSRPVWRAACVSSST